MNPARSNPVGSQIASYLAAGYGVIGLCTWEEDRAKKILEGVAKNAGRVFRSWTILHGFDGKAMEPRDAVRHVIDAAEAGLYVLTDFHTFLSDPQVLRALKEAGSSLPVQGKGIVLLSSERRLPAELVREVPVIDLPLPTETEVLTLIEEAAAHLQRPAPEESVRMAMARGALGLSARDAYRELKRALVAPKPVEAIIGAKARMLATSDLLEYSEPGSAAQDLGGLGEVKRWLQQRSRAFGPLARKFGLPQPKGLFLLGVQGCGKSLTAKAVSALWQIPLIRFDAAGFSSMAENPAAALDRATKVAESLAPCVLWIDEIDKGFAGAGDDARATRALGALITWMQEKTSPVFVVATANNVRALPPELLRKGRFDEIFFVDLPDVHDRLEILKIHIAKRGRAVDQFDLSGLAELTDRFSGAELEQLVISGLYTAFAESRELTQEDLIEAANETVPLAITMDEDIEALRSWARDRARHASLETRRLDFFAEHGRA